MRVLGIDPSTSCGWALFDDGQYTSGVWDLKPVNPKKHPGERLVRLQNYLAFVDPVDKVYYEGVARHNGTHAAHVYGAIVGCLQSCCERGLCTGDYIPIPVPTIKKLATGNGRASKDSMLYAAVKKWPKQFPLIKWKRSKDDDMVLVDKTLYDIADALWILECGLNECGRS